MSKFFNSNKKNKKFKLKINIVDFLEEKGIDFKETSSGEIIIEECPSCSKTYKLYVHEETGVAQCKYAGCDLSAGVSPVTLISKLLDITKGKAFTICYGKQEEKRKSRNDILDDDWSNEFSIGHAKRKKNKKELKEIQFPLLAEELTPDNVKEAWDYLINRGMSPDDIKKVGMKIIPYRESTDFWKVMLEKKRQPSEIKSHMKYLNRVIFPVTVNDKLYGYVARDFTNKVPSKHKVMNSEGSFRSSVFWNYDNVKESSEIVICEGFMDAVKCGIDRSIALLGSVAADGQIELLLKTKAEKIIFCLDVGTEKSQNLLFDQLFIHYPGKIYTVDLPELLVQKENLLNKNIIKIIEELTIDDISYYNEKELILPYSVYIDIKDKLKFNPKWFTTGRFGLDSTDFEKIKKFFSKAEYKDAGDYTKEEMSEFIKNSKIFQKKRKIDF